MNTIDFQNVDTLNYITFNGKITGTKDITAKNGQTYTYADILVNHNGIGKIISYSEKQLILNTNKNRIVPLVQLPLNEVCNFKGIITQTNEGYLKAHILSIVE